MGSTEGNTRKTFMVFLCLWTAWGFLVDRTGAVVRGGEERGIETERNRYRDRKRKKERERGSSTAPSAV